VTRVDFQGGRELDQALADLGKRATAVNVGRRALRKAAEPIRDEWVRLAPEDQGDLKQAIKIGNAIKSENRRGNRGQTISQFIGIDESQNRRLHIYAEVQEFGSDSNPAQPAGRPAFDSKVQESIDRLGADLWSEINKAAERAARKTARLKAKGLL